MSETISQKTLGKSSNTSNISEHDSLPDSIDFLALSQSNITVEVGENTVQAQVVHLRLNCKLFQIRRPKMY